MSLVEDSVFNTEALKYSVKRINQLGILQAARRGQGRRRPEDGERDQQGRRPDEARRAEPQPALVRRRRVAVRGVLRPAVVPDVELPRPRREPHAVDAGRLARAELHARLHRAVPVRPEHDGRRPAVQAGNSLPQPVHADDDRRHVTFGVPLGNFTRFFTNYSYQRVRVSDFNGLHRSDRAAPQSVPAGLAAHRPGRRAGHQQDHAEPRPQHGRQPDFPDVGQRFTRRSISRASAATSTSTSRRSRASSSGSRTHGCRSAPTPTSQYIHQFEGSHSLPIFEKLFLGGEYSVRGFDIRSIGPSDPVTGLVLGGDKSLLFNIEQSFAIAGPVRAILFYDAGQVRARGQSFGWLGAGPAAPAAARRRPDRSESAAGPHRPERTGAHLPDSRPAQRVQDVDGRRNPLLHAGAQRAVPADLLLRSAACGRARQQPAAAASVRVSLCGRIDLLAKDAFMHRITYRGLLLSVAILAMGACSNDDAHQSACGDTLPVHGWVHRDRCRRTARSRTPSPSRTLGAVTATLVCLAPNSAQIVGLQLGVWNGVSCTAASSTDTATTGSSITPQRVGGRHPVRAPVRRRIHYRSCAVPAARSSIHESGVKSATSVHERTAMKGAAIAASLALVLSAAPVFAQAAGQAPRPAAPAPAPPAAAQPAPAPAAPPPPFPAGAKIAFVNLQQVANLSGEGKISTGKVQALMRRSRPRRRPRARRSPTPRPSCRAAAAS